VSDHSPKSQLIAPAASPEEAAAIIAAIERFRRATAASSGHPNAALEPDRWHLAAIHEGLSRDPRDLLDAQPPA